MKMMNSSEIVLRSIRERASHSDPRPCPSVARRNSYRLLPASNLPASKCRRAEEHSPLPGEELCCSIATSSVSLHMWKVALHTSRVAHDSKKSSEIESVFRLIAI